MNFIHSSIINKLCLHPHNFKMDEYPTWVSRDQRKFAIYSTKLDFILLVNTFLCNKEFFLIKLSCSIPGWFCFRVQFSSGNWKSSSAQSILRDRMAAIVSPYHISGFHVLSDCDVRCRSTKLLKCHYEMETFAIFETRDGEFLMIHRQLSNDIKH